MSLVAYAASDDSEESDAEDQDKEESQPLLENTVESKLKPDIESEIENKDIDILLKELPAPKVATGDESYTNIDEEEELEDEVKPKSSQLVDAPKPPPKKKQPVRITIPALDQDLEDEPARKKQKTLPSSLSGKSKLTSLLPAPVHLSVKEANRVLLPYTLKKKPSPAVNPAPTTKQKSTTSVKEQKPLLQGLSGYHSDSEDEEEEGGSSNFFSLGDSNKDVETVVLPQPPPSSNHLRKLNLPAPITELVSNTQLQDNQSEDRLQSEVASKNLSNQSEELTFTSSDQDESLTVNSTVQDEPLQFKSSFVGGSLYHSQSRGNPSSQQDVFHNEKYQYPQYEEHEVYEDPQKKYMLDEDFLKLQGKRQRGREEINIVDVNADDFIGEVDLMKNITVESEYVSQKKEDGPTSQQKRKHQITYLAHQAKERELELKNQWSQNRMTKRQTQAKYGF